MSRYRPPQPPSSPYITATGYEVLQAELTALWRRRVDVVKALSAAAAEGDRSENAEYIYRKRRLLPAIELAARSSCFLPRRILAR